MSTAALDAEMELRVRIKNLLHNIAGDPVPCKGCGSPMYWVEHHNGKRAPYDEDGANHFVTCPKAANFRRRPAVETKARYVSTTLRYRGQCSGCETPMDKDEQAVFDKINRKIYCIQCKEVLEQP